MATLFTFRSRSPGRVDGNKRNFSMKANKLYWIILSICYLKIVFTVLYLTGYFSEWYFTVISIPMLLALAFDEHLAFICLVFLIIVFTLLMGIIFLSILGMKYQKAKSIVLILITIATVFDIIIPLFSVNLLVKTIGPTISLTILILCVTCIVKGKKENINLQLVRQKRGADRDEEHERLKVKR